ncbi:MAG: T9SS type A sorting domain-containing protein, partial [Bacteroidales bacterium]|nr:T9SS type A sorting domain-containing protein [Bacteroidales bacterium]
TIHNSTNTKYDFILYDAQGREVRRENEVLNADYTLDVSSLHSGTYILYCYTKEGREKSIKILINR